MSEGFENRAKLHRHSGIPTDYDRYRSAYAKKLQDLMTLGDFTQDDLAQKLGVNRSTIMRWEKGETLPNVAQWQLIKRAVKDAIAFPED